MPNLFNRLNGYYRKQEKTVLRNPVMVLRAKPVEMRDGWLIRYPKSEQYCSTRKEQRR